jgi:amino acid transporter
VLFLLIPILLVILNSLGIEAYGFAEVISSSLKLAFLLVIIIIMGCINAGAGAGNQIGTSDWSKTIAVYDDAVVDHWVAALFMSMSIAAFSYVGVEIVAASALEARVPIERGVQQRGAVGKTVRFTAIWTSPFAAMLYVLAGILVSLNIKWDDPRLPRMPWIVTNNDSTPDSAFVIVAKSAQLHGLAGTMNVFLLTTALTCANTNLVSLNSYQENEYLIFFVRISMSLRERSSLSQEVCQEGLNNLSMFDALHIWGRQIDEKFP